MISFSVRSCTLDDLAAVVDIWIEAGLTRPWNDPAADFSRAVDGAQSAVLAGVSDERIVSTVMVGEDGHRGWVYYLGVLPRLQGTGLGGRTLAAAEDWLRRRGVEKLNLLLRTSSPGSLGFYEAAGFKKSDVVCLQKTLTPD